jgi:hypothetical protein
LDPLLSVRLPVCSPISHAHALVRGSVVVPSEVRRDLQGWEGSGNEISLIQGTPDARRPLTCPNLARSHLGSGLQTAAVTSACPALTPGLTWHFACVAGVGFEPT